MSSTSKLGGLNFPQVFFLPHQYSLVGGFNPSEKCKSQLGLLFPIYGKNKKKFQTANQFLFVLNNGDGTRKPAVKPLRVL